MTVGDLKPDSRQEVVFGGLRDKSTAELKQLMREEVEMLKELATA